MKATQKLHELGQSVWLDNITRYLLTSGTLRRYINDLSLTGLTSNPTIFDQAIKEQLRLRFRDPRKAQGRKVGREVVLRTCHRRSGPGSRYVPADLEPDERGRRMGIARSPPSSLTTPRVPRCRNLPTLVSTSIRWRQHCRTTQPNHSSNPGMN
jgi:hypothetical protein